jgi:hypothetical protein
MCPILFTLQQMRKTPARLPLNCWQIMSFRELVTGSHKW